MKTYSSRSNALRAAKTAGYTKEQVEIRHDVEAGRYYYIPMVDTPVEEKVETSNAVDAHYDALYGFHECPECGTHLDNGVCDFENVMEAQKGTTNMSDAKAFALAYEDQTHEYACFVCDYEWGRDAKDVFKPDANPVVTEAKGEPKRRYKRTGENNTPHSTVQSPVEYAHYVFDTLKEKGTEVVRKVYIAEAVAAGVNQNTASTQFSKWKKAQ